MDTKFIPLEAGDEVASTNFMCGYTLVFTKRGDVFKVVQVTDIRLEVHKL